MAMQGVSLSVAEKKAVSEYLSGKPLGTARRAGRRRLRRQAGADRQPGGEAAVERLGRRLGQLPLSAEAGPDRRRRAEPQTEMGVRIPGRHAGVRQPVDRRRPRVRRQRQRHRLRARRGHAAASTGRSRRTAACAARRASAARGTATCVYFGDLKANVFALDAVDRPADLEEAGRHARVRARDRGADARRRQALRAGVIGRGSAGGAGRATSAAPSAAASSRSRRRPATRSGKATPSRKRRNSSGRTRRARRCGGRPAPRCGARRRSTRGEARSISAPATRTPGRR